MDQENQVGAGPAKGIRIPYGTVREAVFSGMKPSEMKDQAHFARLQYRLLLHDAILAADAEFGNATLTVIYNPAGYSAKKEGLSLAALVEMLKKEAGISADAKAVKERDLDYYTEVYLKQFEPKEISVHAPYGYNADEWARIRPKYEQKMAKQESEKKAKQEK